MSRINWKSVLFFLAACTAGNGVIKSFDGPLWMNLLLGGVVGLMCPPFWRTR